MKDRRGTTLSEATPMSSEGIGSQQAQMIDASLNSAVQAVSEEGVRGDNGAGQEAVAEFAASKAADVSKPVEQPWMFPRLVRGLLPGRGKRNLDETSDASTAASPLDSFHGAVVNVSAGADHTVAITAAGEMYSWGGVVDSVDVNDSRIEGVGLSTLNGRSLGVLGDGKVRGLSNVPRLVACTAQSELDRIQTQQSLEAEKKASEDSTGRKGLRNPALEKGVQSSTIASISQRRVTSIACGGWHTLAVTSGTHLGLDLRRAFEPGLGNGSRKDYRDRFDRDRSSMNRGLGHWASDLVLLVSEDTGQLSSAPIPEDREMPLGYGTTSSSMLSRPLFAHQVILRHRSPVFAEKIREEELRQAAISGVGNPLGPHTAQHTPMTLLLPDLDFKVALILLEFIYTDTVFTRLLPTAKLVRDTLAAAEEYELPRLKTICQAAIEGEGRALQLHPEGMGGDIGRRRRLGDDVGADDIGNETDDEYDEYERDDTAYVHRVPLPLDSGIASDLSQALYQSENADVWLFVKSTSSGSPVCLYAHAVILMARSSYFEELLFPLMGKRRGAKSSKKDAISSGDEESVESDDEDDDVIYGAGGEPLEIEVPDSEKVLREVLFFIYTGQVHAAGAPSTLRDNLSVQDNLQDNNIAEDSARWLLSLIKASHRYDLPRMRILCESCLSSIIISCGSGGQDGMAAGILGQNAMKATDTGVRLVTACLEMLPQLDNYGARNITEAALGLVAARLHHVVDSPSFDRLAINHPDILQTLMDRVRERDNARR